MLAWQQELYLPDRPAISHGFEVIASVHIHYRIKNMEQNFRLLVRVSYLSLL